MTARIIAAAVELARVGFGIIPCNSDKTPRILWKQYGPMRDPAVIAAYWTLCPDALVGYTPPEGCMVVDVDLAGLAGLSDWPSGGWQYRTRSGGLHAVLALPKGIQGKTDTGKAAPGVDRRGHMSGYAIAWFLHGCEFTGDGGAYQPAPEWTWRDLIGQRAATNSKPFGLSESELRALAARAIKQADRYDNYDEWFQLGMMLHHETGGSELGLELFDQISRAAPKYDPAEIPKKWRSFRSDEGGLRIAKLIEDTGSKDLARASGARAAFREQAIASEIDTSLAPERQNAVVVSAGATGEVVAALDAAADQEALATVLLDHGVAYNPDKAWFWGTAQNVNLAVRVPLPGGHRYAYDTFKSTIVYQCHDDPADDGWRPLDDVEIHECRQRLFDARFDPETTITKVRDAIYLLAHRNEFDSAQMWLDRQVWDGVERVPTFMRDYCGSEDTPYSNAISRYLWTAAAGRIISPGCQADMVVAWISPEQGLQKSQSIKAMNPSWENYTTLNLAERDDNLTRNTFGMLICELGEMRGILKGADIEGVKVWLTKGADFHVPKYIQNGSLIARRFVLIATTNEGEMLNDPSGSRRWLPITVTNKMDPERIERDRAQLWAESAVRFKSLADGTVRNTRGRADYQDAERLARDRAAEFTVYDEMTPSIEEHIAKIVVGGVFAGRDLWGHLGLPAQTGGGSVMDKRIQGILRSLGYEQKLMRHPATDKVARLWRRK
jgi:hypothetical protein